MVPLRWRGPLVLALTGLACESADALVARCLDAGVCFVPDTGVDAGRDAGEDGGVTDGGRDGGDLDAGRDGGDTLDAGDPCYPPDASYENRVAAQWACVRADMLASFDAGRAGPPTFELSPLRDVATPFDEQRFAGGLLLPDLSVVGLPYGERMVVLVDGDGGRVVPLDGGPRTPFATLGGVVGPDGKVILCPGSQPVFVELTYLPAGDRFEATRTWTVTGDAGVLASWRGCVVAPGLGVYAVPAFGLTLLHLPFDGGPAVALPVLQEPAVPPFISDRFSGAVLGPRGEVIGIPASAPTGTPRFLVYSPATRQARLFPDAGPANGHRGGALHPDGTILALPGGPVGTQLTELDLAAGTARSLPGRGTPFDGGLVFADSTIGGVWAPDGTLYLAPATSSPTFPLFAYEADARRFASHSGPTMQTAARGASFEGGVSLPDGGLVFLPRRGSTLLWVHSGARRPFSLSTLRSPFIPSL